MHARTALVDRSVRPDLDAGEPSPASRSSSTATSRPATASSSRSAPSRSAATTAPSLFGTDTTGDERFDLTVRDIDSGEVLDTALTGVGYGGELSHDGRVALLHPGRRRLAAVPAVAAPRRHPRRGRRPAPPGGRRALLDGRRDEPRRALGHPVASAPRRPRRSGCCPPTSPRGSSAASPPGGTASSTTSSPPPTGCSSSTTPTTPTPTSPGRPLDATSHETVAAAARRPPPASGSSASTPSTDAAVLSLRSGGLTALRVLPRDPSSDSGLAARPRRRLRRAALLRRSRRQPGGGDDAVQVLVESFVTPRTVLEIDVVSGERDRPQAPAGARRLRPGDYAQRREWAAAPDGDARPASRSSTGPGWSPTAPIPGCSRHTAPTSPPTTPTSPSPRLSLLDRGVVYAVAHVRGGGEMGRHWYDDGKLLAKPHTFTDLVACADHLLDDWLGRPATGSPSRAARRVGSPSVRPSTSPRTASASSTPRCPSSTP